MSKERETAVITIETSCRVESGGRVVEVTRKQIQNEKIERLAKLFNMDIGAGKMLKVTLGYLT